MGHTPGLWFVSEGQSGYVSSDVRAVSVEAAPTEADPLGWTIAVILGDGPPMEANARLIAAAPELLEALIDAVDDLKAIRQVRGDIIDTDRYEATIKKATA